MSGAQQLPDPGIAAMCSCCGYLGWCIERQTVIRRRVMVCAVCRGVEVDFAVMKKPAARAVSARTREVKAG